MQDGLINMLSNAVKSAGFGSGKAGGNENGNGRAEAFSGFLKTFMQAAETNTEPARRVDLSGKDSGFDGNDFGANLSPRRKEALERIATLTADGGIDKNRLRKMSSNELDELEEWAADGAGGLFPPIPEESVADMSGGAVVGGETADVVDGVDASQNGDVDPVTAKMSTEDIMKALAAMIVGGEQLLQSSGTMVGQSAGLAGLSEEQLAGLAEALKANLAELSANGVEGAFDNLSNIDRAGLSELLFGLSAEDIAGAIEKSFGDSGLELPDGGVKLTELPKVVLESLVVEITGVGGDFGEVEDMLGNLAKSNPLAGAIADGVQKRAEENVAPVAAQAGAVEVKTMSSDSANEVAAEIEADDLGLKVKVDDRENAGDASAENGDSADNESANKGDVHSTSLEEVKADDGMGEDVDVSRKTGSQQSGVDAIVSDGFDGQVGFGGMTTGASEDSSEFTVDLADDAVGAVHAARAEVAPNAAPVQQPAVAPEARAAYLAENIEKLEDVMRMSVKRGMQEVSIQLSPEELGKVSLRVEMKDGVVSAFLRTENVEARDMLAGGLQQLKQNLQVQGIELDSFDVQLGDGQQGGADFFDNTPRRHGNKGSSSSNKGAASGAEAAEGSSGVFGIDGGLNVVA